MNLAAVFSTAIGYNSSLGTSKNSTQPVGSVSGNEAFGSMLANVASNKDLVSPEISDEDNGMFTDIIEELNAANKTELLTLIQDHPEMVELLEDANITSAIALNLLVIFSQNPELSKLSGDELITKLSELTDDALAKESDVGYLPMITTELPAQLDVLFDKLQLLIDQVKEVVAKVDENSDVKQSSTELLALLKDWTSLERKGAEKDLTEMIGRELSHKELSIWKQLVSNYDKRNQLSQNGQYQSNAQITKSDIANWLQQSLSNYVEPTSGKIDASSMEKLEEVSSQLLRDLIKIIQSNEHGNRPVSIERFNSTVANASQQITLTKLEQQVLQTGSAEEVEELSEQLVKQISAIIQSSNVFTEKSEVTIVVQPDELGNATVNLQQVNNTISNGSQQVVMSEVQQHVIHTTSTERVEEVSDRLVRQFTNVVSSGKFLNGKSEITLMLRPDHLGNMTVKLEQVNGEMMVRILVSSLATKGVLEANIDQLKHVFLPHQVIIEKNELTIDEQVMLDKQEEELAENGSSNEEENNQSQEEKTSEIDFQTIFQQINLELIGSEEYDDN